MLNFDNGVCFVTNGDENNLVQKMLKYLEDSSNFAHETMTRKFAYVFYNWKLVKILEKNLTKVYCREPMVIRFNSASDDLKI